MIKKSEKYIFFDRTEIYSNSWRSDFNLDGINFSSVEQGYQYLKAKYFGDNLIAQEILRVHDPSDCRELGRRVNRFSRADWSEKRREFMFRCVYAKFNQDVLLREKILATGFNHFAALGSDDSIWSIGLDLDSAGLDNFVRWPGHNLLGEVLVKVRETIRLTLFLSCGIYY